MDYKTFLESKVIKFDHTGIDISDHELSDQLFDFQKMIVKNALKKGKYAIFADCGLGKTFMQLEWSRIIEKNEKAPILILAPLAVSKQTKEEGERFGINVTIAESSDDIGTRGIYITNYEKLHKFDPDMFVGIVLDESSILKNMDGKTRNQIIDSFSHTKYKLACTATPSPNDYVEMGNHAEFLNVCSVVEMLAMFFINDAQGKNGKEAIGWRLKKHAEDNFWKFVGSWATMVQKPSDLGCSDKGYSIPELKVVHHVLDVKEEQSDTLFVMPAASLNERREARRNSLDERVAKTLEIVKKHPKDQFLIWCDYNNEADALADALSEATEIRGSDKDKAKEDGMMGFAHGTIRILVSKPSICGFGMNFQGCHRMIFCGLSDSYEMFYQAIRRSWRFGQKNEVTVDVIISEKEISVLENILEKQRKHQDMFTNMVKNISAYFQSNFHMEYKKEDVVKDNYKAMLGDCVERIADIKDESVDYTIFSPPFASLYTYSNSERDMGNCKNADEFYKHFTFLVKEMYRTTKPGRLLSFHCMNLPTSKMRDGYIGISDFRGDLIRMFIDAGWIYHSEVCIWKDPVVAMQRTKALGLLHKQIKKDSSMSRQGIPDYLVTMRKPGENKEPITHTAEEFTVDMWQKIASPVWMDIRQSNTLQKESAREEKDEKHICPLQLEVIERALYLWSNPNDLVLSPFMGIGSEGYCSLKLGRRFIGIELKESYFKQAVKNLATADESSKQLTIC